MSGRISWSFWLLLLAVVLLILYFMPPVEQDVVEVAQRSNSLDTKGKTTIAADRPKPASVASTALPNISSRAANPEVSQAFEQHTWTPQQPKRIPKPQSIAPVLVEVSPTPQAPPLPFRYLGRYVEADQTIVFLAHNDQNLALKVGETFSINYKLDEIKTNALTFTYLPLNAKQSLDIGSTP
jgi:hypothetical protein